MPKRREDGEIVFADEMSAKPRSSLNEHTALYKKLAPLAANAIVKRNIDDAQAPSPIALRSPTAFFLV